MVNHFPVSRNRKFPEPAIEPEEEQEAQQDVVVDVVYNTYTERNGKTIALTVSLRLPRKP